MTKNAAVTLIDAGAAFTDWLSFDAYQAAFDAAVAKHMYPRVVEGRNNGGVDEYRGEFVAYPRAGFGFYSHHGFSDQWLQTYDQQYSAKGMVLRYSQMFTGASGATLHCATWTD